MNELEAEGDVAAQKKRLTALKAEVVRLQRCYRSIKGDGCCGESPVAYYECNQMTKLRVCSSIRSGPV